MRVACLLILVLAAPTATAQSRAASERQLSDIKSQISGVEKQVKSARSEEATALQAIEGLDTEIRLRETLIGGYQTQVELVKAETKTLRSSIGRLESEIENTKRSYRERARHAYMHGRRNNLALLLASSSINQMLVRARYLQRFASARRRQVERIEQKTAEMRAREVDVQRSLEDAQRLLGQTRIEQSQLAQRRRDRTALVAEVRTKRGRLERQLAQRRTDAAQLEGMLRELAAEERRRAEAERQRQEEAARRERERIAEAARQAEIQRRADEAAELARREAQRRTAPTPRAEDPDRTPPAAPPPVAQAPPPAPPRRAAPAAPPPAADRPVSLTGSFRQNKGRLPWPVEGTVTGEFGTRVDPIYGSETTARGMDISTAPGAPVRAVFEGTVNRVGQMATYGTFVWVSHGEFLTFYGNLSQVSVRQGEAVRAGQALGRAGTAEDRRGAALFFGLGEGGTFVNPRAWLR